uniref:Uncharacterized protein n=1 Tax=Physcomitrium patens TaxID=3218 RepID=A0A7I4DWB9_PHYPA|nr:uncharacterized protein LOC112282179 isoform X2 [Physcomitrium patens]|eukprot:XP_024375297.1 uncharacterized protein LOC112282179 isoform X2 [Physcomitrella patens]
MGRTNEVGSQESTSFTVLEKGEIYFFFKPKVGVEKPHTGDDVQRMIFVLRPQVAEKGIEEKQSSDTGKEGQFEVEKKSVVEGHEKTGSDKSDAATEEEAKAEGDSTEEKSKETTGEEKDYSNKGDEDDTAKKENQDLEVEIGEKHLFRYIVMGRKSLPDAAKGKSRPYWGFVELITSNPEDLKKMLSEGEYDTKTRGYRVNPAARPVGEGRYSIVRHHRDNKQTSIHLVYKLEHPGQHEKHGPQDAMNIETQASFVIQVKNPKQAEPLQPGSKRQAILPAYMLGKMGPKRFVPVDPPDLLNYEGVEFLLISARDELVDAEVDAELEISDSLSKEVRDLMDLVVSSKGHEKLTRPLFEGVWA